MIMWLHADLHACMTSHHKHTFLFFYIQVYFESVNKKTIKKMTFQWRGHWLPKKCNLFKLLDCWYKFAWTMWREVHEGAFIEAWTPAEQITGMKLTLASLFLWKNDDDCSVMLTWWLHKPQRSSCSSVHIDVLAGSCVAYCVTCSSFLCGVFHVLVSFSALRYEEYDYEAVASESLGNSPDDKQKYVFIYR